MPWPFDREYMQLALAAGLVVGTCAPLIGAFLVPKRLSLMGASRLDRAHHTARQVYQQHVATPDLEGRHVALPKVVERADALEPHRHTKSSSTGSHGTSTSLTRASRGISSGRF